MAPPLVGIAGGGAGATGIALAPYPAIDRVVIAGCRGQLSH